MGYDVIIVGGGIIGVCAAYELSKYQLSIGLLEKHNDIANETTKANSAILHAGYDPKPGSLMAKANVRGAQLAQELCRNLNVPYRSIGSLVLGFTKEDEKTLKELFRRGEENGVTQLQILSKEEVLKMEPAIHSDVVAALYAPTAAVVNPWEYAIAVAETALKNGVEFYMNSQVTAIEKTEEGYRVKAGDRVFETRCIINAAGLYADEVHDLALAHAFDIHPVKGEYYLLDKSEGSRVNHVIFQCPTQAGKGVLVSPTVHGNLLVGPNAEPVDRKDNVATTSEGLSFVMNQSKKSVPSINFRQSIRNFAGLRAAPVGRNDFIIERAAKGWIDLAGIQSPGLTAAPAIAEMAASLLKEEGWPLKRKEHFVNKRDWVRFSHLSEEEKKEWIKKDPSFGRIICRCEQITEGEIRRSLRSPLTPPSIDAVKRRCNAGMGRCQSGFCGPRVLSIICEEKHCQPEEVLQDKKGSRIILGETKKGGGHCV